MKQTDNAPHAIAYTERAMSRAAYPTEHIQKLHGDPVWEAIWATIKQWDINTPDYGGYCGANGDHVTQIYEAVIAALATTRGVETG